MERGEGNEMEVDVEEGKEIERSKPEVGGGANDQEKPAAELESLTLAQDQDETDQTGEETGSASRCTPCLMTKALKLPTIKEMLESLDQWRRLHGTREDMASSLEHGLTSLNIRNREEEEREAGLGFCAAISLADGTVLHTTSSLTATLGYPGNPKIILLAHTLLQMIPI